MSDRLRIAPAFQLLAVIALLGFILILLHLAAPVVVPVMLALFIVAIALPAFRWFLGHGWNRTWALIGAMFLLFVAFGFAILLAWVSVQQLSEGMAVYSEDLQARVAEYTDDYEVLSALVQSGTIARILSALLISAAALLLPLLSQLVIAVVLAAFMLAESSRFDHLIATDLSTKPFFAQLPAVGTAAVAYILIRTKLNFFTAAGIGIVLLLLGVDYWPLWTLLIFFMSYVPYIGLAVALVPPCLLAFAETGIVPVIIIVVVAIIINTVVENFLAPVATGKTLRLSPTVVFISFLLWTWLLGPAGALLSMPITVLVMLVLQTSEQTQWAAEIIGSTPVSEIPAATATEG